MLRQYRASITIGLTKPANRFEAEVIKSEADNQVSVSEHVRTNGNTQIPDSQKIVCLASLYVIRAALLINGGQNY